METESSGVYKVYLGAEVYLNGRPIGNGEVGYEAETSYEEAWYGEMGPSKTCPTKHTFRITIPEGSHPLQGDWIIKRYASDGSIKEAAFSGQEEAQRVMQLFQDLGLEGHFELVCRPRAEDVAVNSYRNEPEEETLDKPEDDRDFDREKSYRDSGGDIWNYLPDQSEEGSSWYFQEEKGGPQHGPFFVPLLGPHEEVVDEEGIIDPRDLLKSRQYLDSDGCVWGYRTYEGEDGPHWHWRLEGSSDWDPFWFPNPVDGPWTEYRGQD